MKMLRSLLSSDEKDLKWPDNAFHFIVSVVLVILNLIYVYSGDKAIDHVPSTLSSGTLGLLMTQAVYHLVVMLQLYCYEDAEEADTGKALRNTLTSASLVLTVVSLSHEIDALNKTGDALLWTTVILLAVMRILDSILDAGSFTGAFTVQCLQSSDSKNGNNNEAEEKKIECIGAWGARALIVHGLIAGSGVLALINRLDLNDEKNEHVDESTWTILMITMILIAVHLCLHPIVLIVKALGLEEGCMKCCRCALCCGQSKRYNQLDDCGNEELVSLSRVPMVRQVVAGLILVGLSYSIGALYTLQKVHLLLASLALYLGADIIGRNYI